MKTAYPVIFTSLADKKGTYLISVPDLDGISEGYGLANAISMARDLIGCKLYELDESKYPIPSSFEDVKLEKSPFADEGKSMVSLVDVDMDAYRREIDNQPVRRNVSLPGWLNKKANEAHINVSRVLQDALIEKLNL